MKKTTILLIAALLACCGSGVRGFSVIASAAGEQTQCAQSALSGSSAEQPPTSIARTSIMGGHTANTSRLPVSPPITFPVRLYDYVGYAITRLPAHYRTPTVASSDFTSPNIPITNAGANLGRVLFYDKHLSANDAVACASCHHQRLGFGDENQFSQGFAGQITKRHSMSLGNVRYYRHGRYFWDERANSLEMQSLMPIADKVEMGSDLRALPGKMAALSYYPPLFQMAFGSPQITTERISRALAQFLRSMVTYQAKYDEAAAAGEDGFERVFTQEELRGKRIFVESRCHFCHSTDLQTALAPTNNGLDADIVDRGNGAGQFKVPSLRNVAVRERYMHDGRFSSLDDVIEFYNSQVNDNPALGGPLRNEDGTVRRLNLSAEDKAALKAFLETLTDEKFLTDPKFSNPFEER